MNPQDTYQPSLQSMRLEFEPRGWINEDVHTFLTMHGCHRAAAHCSNVARTAYQLAERFGTDPMAAEASGWLPDFSSSTLLSTETNFRPICLSRCFLRGDTEART